MQKRIICLGKIAQWDDDLGGRSPPVKGVSSKAPHASITTRLFTDCQGYCGRHGYQCIFFFPNTKLKTAATVKQGIQSKQIYK